MTAADRKSLALLAASQGRDREVSGRMGMTRIVAYALALAAALFGGAYLAGLGWTLGVKAAWGEPNYEEMVE